MRAIRSEERTSYEKAVYHIERMNVKEKFFRSPANKRGTRCCEQSRIGKNASRISGFEGVHKEMHPPKKVEGDRERKILAAA